MSEIRRSSSYTSRGGLAVLLLLAAVAGLAGCQRGEKSCRYYSLVLERSEASEDKRRALDEIKKMSAKDQLKCDDDKVFERFGKVMEDNKFRPMLVETLENVGRAGGKLRDRSEKLLLKGLGYNDAAAQVAGVIRTWRLESAESGKDPWLPSPQTAERLADAIRKATQGSARAPLVEALFLALPDAESRGKYEDLLIELADTDPASQAVEVNIKALQYLTEMKSNKDATFDTYVHGLFMRDAARAETFMAARLGLATFPRERVAAKMLGIFLQKDQQFADWAKKYGLFDWEWKEGPKVPQILADVHVPDTASALVQQTAKPVDVTETGTPKSFVAVNKALPYAGYVISRIQLTMWALASMGKGLEPVAEEIGTLAKTSGLGVEQRTMPFISLALSGASNAWPVMAKTFAAIDPVERGDFLTPMSYAVDTDTLAEWDRVIGGDTAESVVKGREDAVIKGRLTVVRECQKAEAAAPDDAARGKAVLDCYLGFLKSGDDIAKERAAVSLVHLGARGGDVVMPLLEAFEKSAPTSPTLRQIILAGLKNFAKPEHAKRGEGEMSVYHVQQLQVAHGAAAQTWIWDLEVLLSHLAQAAKAGAAPAAGQAPAAPAAPAAAGQ